MANTGMLQRITASMKKVAFDADEFLDDSLVRAMAVVALVELSNTPEALLRSGADGAFGKPAYDHELGNFGSGLMAVITAVLNEAGE